jgi:meiotic recombination protein SPO11
MSHCGALLAIEEAVAAITSRLLAQQDPTLGLPGSAPLMAHSPSAGYRGARELCGMLRVLASSYELLRLGKTATTREVFYMHAAFFKDASESAGAIARVMRLLKLPRPSLGLLAASRGWFAGALRLASEPLLRGGNPISSDAVSGPLGVQQAGARFLLIVEKECIFRRLVEDRLWELPGMRCILVTGCGQPDLATRAFVQEVAQAHGPGLPVLGLADCNPFGLQILLTYAHGSAAHPEASCYAVPQLHWLGLRCSDLARFGLPASALQPMSHVDDARAAAQLQLQHVSCSEQLRTEVQAWLSSRKKMELEGLLAGGIGFLVQRYLPEKLGLHQQWPASAGSAFLDMQQVDALPLSSSSGGSGSSSSSCMQEEEEEGEEGEGERETGEEAEAHTDEWEGAEEQGSSSAMLTW